VRAGLQFGSSFGGFLGSIQFAGGGAFGGGGACAATGTAAVDRIIPARIDAITALRNRLAINASSNTTVESRLL